MATIIRLRERRRRALELLRIAGRNPHGKFPASSAVRLRTCTRAKQRPGRISADAAMYAGKQEGKDRLVRGGG